MNVDLVCPVTTNGALERASIIGPDVEAVVCGDKRITYSQLAVNVQRVRSAMKANGLQKGEHVALCLGNGPEWVTLFLAATSLGAVVVPINTRFRAAEIAYVLNQSRSAVLFTADKFLRVDFISMLREINPAIDGASEEPNQLPGLRQIVVLGTDIPSTAVSFDDYLASGQGTTASPTATPDDVALIQYTSGTTSFPKGVLLTHRSLCANAFFSGGRMGLRTGDRFHSARPFFHVAGSSLSVLSCLQHVSTLVTMPRFEPSAVLRLFEEERCTHFSGNDTIALMLLNHPDRPHRRLYLRGAWIAASPTVVRRVIDELGATEAVVGYGLSEASPNVAQSAWWEDEETRVSGSMLPEPGVEVRIRATDIEPQAEAALPWGQVGEILVRGWNVMQGYFDLPDQTAEALAPSGWLSTGDLGRLDENGRLTFVGRAKEIIRVGGENVAPAEVEDILHRHPQVRLAIVVGVPDERLIEVPFAFIQLRPGESASEGGIRDWAKDNMAGFKVPHYVHIVDNFESIGMTASSKVQKNLAVLRAKKLLEEGVVL